MKDGAICSLTDCESQAPVFLYKELKKEEEEEGKRELSRPSADG